MKGDIWHDPLFLAGLKGGGQGGSASGPIVTFTGDGSPLRSLRIGIDPVQEGTGDPSPDNVRPISGWDEANVWVKPTYDPTADPTATIQLGQTVYGGYISVSEDGSAELTVDRAMVDLGTLTYSYQADNKRFLFFVDGKKGEGDSIATPNFICSYYKPVTAYYFDGHKDETGIIRGSTTLNGYMFLRDLSETNPTNLKTKLSGQTVVYELATPLHYPLSDIEVTTLAGANVMWADCGEIAVEWAGGKGFGKEAMLAWVMHR